MIHVRGGLEDGAPGWDLCPYKERKRDQGCLSPGASLCLPPTSSTNTCLSINERCPGVRGSDALPPVDGYIHLPAHLEPSGQVGPAGCGPFPCPDQAVSAPPAFLKPCASTLNRRVRVGQPFRSYGALGNLPASGYWLDMWRL